MQQRATRDLRGLLAKAGKASRRIGKGFKDNKENVIATWRKGDVYHMVKDLVTLELRKTRTMERCSLHHVFKKAFDSECVIQ